MGWNDRIGLCSAECRDCGQLYHFFENDEDGFPAYPCKCNLAKSAKVSEAESRLEAQAEEEFERQMQLVEDSNEQTDF